MAMERENYESCYVISVAANMLGVHTQTLRYYERMGLIEPSRSQGNTRLYSDRDIERLRQIKTLTNDLGVNLAGVEVILRLMQHMREMEQQMHQLEQEVKRLSEGGSYYETG
jgi:MerR family transcriptional regulator/heat shock protein HspR